MKIHHRTLQNNNAISEIVGSVILLLIAVLSFSMIYLYVFPLPEYAAESNIDIQGSVSGEYAELLHVGGETLQEYQILVDGEVYKGNSETEWRKDCNMGSLIEKIPFGESKKIKISIVSKNNDGGTETVFEGEFDNPSYNEKPTQGNPYFFSSLLQNTTSEDLIIQNGSSSDPEGNQVNSIYTWFRNDESFATLYLPFNTNASVETKDYTDSENNGNITGANWNSAGKVGGSYEFTDEGDVISCSLPTVFSDLSNNDFSVTTWAKSVDISENQNCIFEAYNDSDNFVQVFQHNSQIFAGVCVDSEKYVLKTEPLLSDTWYHIGVIWDSSKKSIQLFINGLANGSSGDESVFSPGNNPLLYIGQKTDGSHSWKGLIDEFYVYDHLVSEDHVYQQYLCSQDGSSDVSVIVSEETKVEDEWYCIVTPNDSYQDGDEKITLEITIQ